jgi:uncharacterized membrane protein YkvA (DUF1232 family)
VDFDLTTFLLAFISLVLVVGLVALVVVAYVIRRKRIPLTGAAALIGAVLYLISPVDAVPEFAFGPIGLLDDAGVLSLAAMYAAHVLRARRAGMPIMARQAVTSQARRRGAHVVRR